jgi:hypothetical protein
MFHTVLLDPRAELGFGLGVVSKKYDVQWFYCTIGR